jgi:hypothetical protein
MPGSPDACRGTTPRRAADLAETAARIVPAIIAIAGQER